LIRSFRAGDCDTNHHLDVEEVRERLAVNKQRSHKFGTEMFSLKKLNDVHGKEKYSVEVSNRFAALEEFSAEVQIKSAWETIGENIKMSVKKSLVFMN
jgi:hypothetical protein